MKMSTRGQYALEIAVDLALHLMPDRLESLNDIAKRRNLSEKYLERIMKLLKEAGLVKSVRGAYGGYCLTKEPGEISVLEVLRAAEGQLAPVSCLVENTECGMECEICSTKSTWGEMWEQILDTAAEVTVADIAEIEKQDFILTPGRYVGIEEQEDDGEPFEEKMTRLTSELSELFDKSHELEDEIRRKLRAIGYDI